MSRIRALLFDPSDPLQILEPVWLIRSEPLKARRVKFLLLFQPKSPVNAWLHRMLKERKRLSLIYPLIEDFSPAVIPVKIIDIGLDCHPGKLWETFFIVQRVK